VSVCVQRRCRCVSVCVQRRCRCVSVCVQRRCRCVSVCVQRRESWEVSNWIHEYRLLDICVSVRGFACVCVNTSECVSCGRCRDWFMYTHTHAHTHTHTHTHAHTQTHTQTHTHTLRRWVTPVPLPWSRSVRVCLSARLPFWQPRITGSSLWWC